MIRRVLFIVLLMMSAAACTPRLAPMGPPVVQARLDTDKVVVSDGAELPLKKWLPDGEPKAVILGLHGFNDYSNAFAIPAASWVNSGIATYAYDQRGFGAAPDRGLWPGTDTLVADLDTTYRLLRARYPNVPIFLAGESMGGAVIMAAVAAGRVASADGVILVAPAVRGRDTINVFARSALWVVAHTVPWLAGQPPPNLGFHPSDNIEMLRALGRDPMVIKETRVDALYGLVNLMDDALAASPLFDKDVLILLGRRDDLIPDGPTGMMLARMPAAMKGMRRVAVYPNGYHMLLRDLQAPVVHRDVAAWALGRKSDPLAALPSGADRLGPPSLADLHTEKSGEP